MCSFNTDKSWHATPIFCYLDTVRMMQGKACNEVPSTQPLCSSGHHVS